MSAKQNHLWALGHWIFWVPIKHEYWDKEGLFISPSKSTWSAIYYGLSSISQTLYNHGWGLPSLFCSLQSISIYWKHFVWMMRAFGVNWVFEKTNLILKPEIDNFIKKKRFPLTTGHTLIFKAGETRDLYLKDLGS